MTETNRLDSAITNKLEVSLTEPENRLYKDLKTRTVIRLWDRRKHDARIKNLAFTYSYNTHSDVWISPDDADMKDTFLHELGQVNNFVLGYRGADVKDQADSNMKLIASFINNAFIGAIAELNLEKRGLDRSYYKTRMVKAVKVYLASVPNIEGTNLQSWKTPKAMADFTYSYVVNKLVIGDAFTPLEDLWKAKVRVPEVRLLAKNMYKEAIRKTLTPERYSELQEIMAKSIGVRHLIRIGVPYSKVSLGIE